MSVKINGITVCVNYSDILAITLPHNLKHFDRIVVITDSQDTKTMDLCNKYPNVELYITDSFYDNGAKFNKGKAMEEGLDYMGREGWICIFDADILMPNNMDLSIVKEGNLYGPRRRIVEDIQGITLDRINIDWTAYPVYPESEFAGYFQLFNGNDIVLKDKKPWYSVDWSHAGGCDSDFQSKWDNNHKIRLDNSCDVLHLGSAGLNWNGRATLYVDGTETRAMQLNLNKQLRMLDERKRVKGFEQEKVKVVTQEEYDYSDLVGVIKHTDIGVVIPNYNYAEYIKEAIDSVLYQTVAPHQIVIVDDHSTDNSVEVINKIIHSVKKYYNNISLLSTDVNSGGGEARNVGIKALEKRIKYVVCLDADDKLEYNYLEICHNEMKSNKADVVYTNAMLFGDYQGILEVPKFNALTFRAKNLVNVSAMFNRELSDGFDKQLRNNFEDYDHWFSMFVKGAKFHKINNTWIHYRKHGETEIVKACKNLLDIKQYFRNKYNGIYLG
jgi:vacuolar-type H+-ATPase subunit F/Vma7